MSIELKNHASDNEHFSLVEKMILIGGKFAVKSFTTASPRFKSLVYPQNMVVNLVL